MVKKEKLAAFMSDYKNARIKAGSHGGNGFDQMIMTRQIDTYEKTIELWNDHSAHCIQSWVVKCIELPQRVPLLTWDLNYFLAITTAVALIGYK